MNSISFSICLFLLAGINLNAQTIVGFNNYSKPCCDPNVGNNSFSLVDWVPELDNGTSVTSASKLRITSPTGTGCVAMPAAALVDTDGDGNDDGIDPCNLTTGTTYCVTAFYMLSGGAVGGSFYAGQKIDRKETQIVKRDNAIDSVYCIVDVDGTGTLNLSTLIDWGNSSVRDNTTGSIDDTDEGWTTTDGNSSIATPNEDDPIFTYTYPNNGNIKENVTLTYTTGSGACDYSHDVSVTIHDAAEASWTNPGTFDISPVPQTWNADVAVSAAEQSDVDAQWTISSGSISSDRSSATFTPITAGDYDVTYTVGFGTLGNGCRNSQTHTIKVNPNCDTTYRSEIDTTVCDIYILVNGTVITQGGTYTDSLTAVDGCDSIITHLVNINTFLTTKDTVIYFVSSSNFYNHHDLIDSIGIDTLIQSNNCDSIITRYEMFTYLQGDTSDTMYITDTNLITVFDTTFISVEDTSDTMYITDTNLITVFDTTFISVEDTSDTLYITDTNLVTVFDTTFISVEDTSDTLYITDTNLITVFDTTFISVEDTLIIRMGVTTSSGLSQSLFNEVIVYPNPASELIVIEFDVEGDYQIVLNNSSGQIVSLNNNVSNYLEIEISDLAKGLYFISIRDNQNTFTQEERKVLIK
jgi:hypothetical protein